MIQLEWNWFGVLMMAYCLLVFWFGHYLERSNSKHYIYKLEDDLAEAEAELMELYAQQDALHEIIHELSTQTPTKPIRQARG